MYLSMSVLREEMFWIQLKLGNAWKNPKDKDLFM